MYFIGEVGLETIREILSASRTIVTLLCGYTKEGTIQVDILKTKINRATEDGHEGLATFPVVMGQYENNFTS